jgi:Pyridoxal-dependent decarboxylase, pyridoxal binding domain
MPLTEVADQFGTQPTSPSSDSALPRDTPGGLVGRCREGAPDDRRRTVGRGGGSRSWRELGDELATALVAGVDPNRIVVHATAATSGEFCKAASVRVGRIVVDSPREVAFLATGVRRPQSVQVRVTPDIDLHEHAVERILDQPLLYLVGRQCHVGSQVTNASLYGEAIRQMVPLMAEVRARHGVILTELKIRSGQPTPLPS